MSMPRILALFCVWIVALGPAGCQGEKPTTAKVIRAEKKPNIIFLTVDTLRADRLARYGNDRDTMPTMEALADESVVFTQALVPRGATRPSYASMLTGLYPYRHGVRTNATVFHEDLLSLAEVLKAEGYHTASFVSNFVMIASISQLDQGFDVYDDEIEERERVREMYERKAEDTVRAMLEWLKTDPPQPFFLFTNFIDPHGPYDPPGDFATKYDSGKVRELDARQIPAYIRVPGMTNWYDYVDRYDGEASYLDEALGILVKELKDRGIWDNSFIVFTADHGESFGEHGAFFQHEHGVWEETLHVPLFLRLPVGEMEAYEIEPCELRTLASPLDLMPTVLDYLDVEVEVDFDGESLLNALAGNTTDLDDRTLFLEHSNACQLYRTVPDVFALRTEEHKLIKVFEPDSTQFKGGALFNVALDPDEKAALRFDARTASHREMAQRLDTFIADVRSYRPPFKVTVYDLKQDDQRRKFIAKRKQEDDGMIHKELSPEHERKLRSLGYLD